MFVQRKNPNAQNPTRVLTPKTFHFVTRLWDLFQHILLHGNVPIVDNVEEEQADDQAINDNDENSFVEMRE
jgi:hypothetical protein